MMIHPSEGEILVWELLEKIEHLFQVHLSVFEFLEKTSKSIRRHAVLGLDSERVRSSRFSCFSAAPQRKFRASPAFSPKVFNSGRCCNQWAHC